MVRIIFGESLVVVMLSVSGFKPGDGRAPLVQRLCELRDNQVNSELAFSVRERPTNNSVYLLGQGQLFKVWLHALFQLIVE